jgi:hypothetical protein
MFKGLNMCSEYNSITQMEPMKTIIKDKLFRKISHHTPRALLVWMIKRAWEIALTEKYETEKLDEVTFNMVCEYLKETEE